MNINVQCAFCGASCSSTCCQSCSMVSRVEKFSRLLNRFGALSNSIRYHEGIAALVERSWPVMKNNTLRNSSMFFFIQSLALVTSLRFSPIQVFDGIRHRLDLVAHTYLKKVDNCPSDLSPVAVAEDGNCLYHSMVLLMNDPTIGVAELRGSSIAYPVLACIDMICF